MKRQPVIILATVLAGAAWLLAGVCVKAWSQKKNATPPARQEQGFGRPAPRKPLKPQVPSANRYQSGKVFLERADSLYTTPATGRERQILKGNVEFRQAGMFMYCDSAYYYPEHNSMDAFGNVRMEQGDTLRGYADVVFYNGDTRQARMRTRGTQQVRLVNRDVTLTTDSLDYDLIQEIGWYGTGGKIEDKVNVLTSRNGQYSPVTKLAEFDIDVRLVNNKDGYTLTSEKLLYNTGTHLASISTPTRIAGATDTILTTQGEYNTVTDNARLDQRSTIIHRDSAGNIITLEGDSILYSKPRHISEAYSFRDRAKESRPTVLTDTARSVILIGGHGLYNDSLRLSFATDYPLLKEYSRGDTIFLRADTIYGQTLSPDQLARIRGLNSDSERKEIIASTLDESLDPEGPTDEAERNEMPVETVETVSVTEITGKLPEDSIPAKDTYFAKAYNRARFFNKDIQGVADSISLVQADSLLFMDRLPVVWSGERQVAGNRIVVHFNDSTADRVWLPDYGIMSEHVADEFYNQMAAKEMTALLTDGTLDRLEASGNVQVIFLPQENDSSYNKLVHAESSFMTIDMSEGETVVDSEGNKQTHRKLDKLKMWPETTGYVTPIFKIKKNQLYLPQFQILEPIRPRRSWYNDGTARWADDLGDIPEELERYFRETKPMNGRTMNIE